MRFLASGFFHESVSPVPLSIPWKPFRNLYKNSRIYTNVKFNHCMVSTTPAKKGKNLRQKVFPYFIWKLFDFSIHIESFFKNVHFKVYADWCPYNSFITGLVDTGGKLSLLSSLPPITLQSVSWNRENHVSSNSRKNSKWPQWDTQVQWGGGGDWYKKL